MKREGLEATIALVNALAFDDAADEFGREFRATNVDRSYYGVPVSVRCSAPKADWPSMHQAACCAKVGRRLKICWRPAVPRAEYRGTLPAGISKATDS